MSSKNIAPQNLINYDEVNNKLSVFFLGDKVVTLVNLYGSWVIHHVRGEVSVRYDDWTDTQSRGYFEYLIYSLGFESIDECYLSVYSYFSINVSFIKNITVEPVASIADSDCGRLALIMPIMSDEQIEEIAPQKKAAKLLIDQLKIGANNKQIDNIVSPDDKANHKTVGNDDTYVKFRAINYVDEDLRSSLSSVKTGVIVTINSVLLKVIIKDDEYVFSCIKIKDKMGGDYLNTLAFGDEVVVKYDEMGLFLFLKEDELW